MTAGTASSGKILFYHNPMSRGGIVHWMLEEVGAEYEIKLLDFSKNDHKSPAYLAVNPMGKIPAIVHRNVVITEAAAICTYLADAFPAAKLAPALDQPERGSFLRWMFFGAGCLEPAFADKAFPRVATARASSLGHGSFEQTIETLAGALSPGPYLLGKEFSAADLYLAAQLHYAMMFKTLEERPVFTRYVKACQDRPAFVRQQKQFYELMAKLKGSAQA